MQSRVVVRRGRRWRGRILSLGDWKPRSFGRTVLAADGGVQRLGGRRRSLNLSPKICCLFENVFYVLHNKFSNKQQIFGLICSVPLFCLTIYSFTFTALHSTDKFTNKQQICSGPLFGLSQVQSLSLADYSLTFTALYAANKWHR